MLVSTRQVEAEPGFQEKLLAVSILLSVVGTEAGRAKQGWTELLGCSQWPHGVGIAVISSLSIPSRVSIPFCPWKCPRPVWVGLGAAWGSGIGREWNEMGFKVFSNQNHSMIL